MFVNLACYSSLLPGETHRKKNKYITKTHNEKNRTSFITWKSLGTPQKICQRFHLQTFMSFAVQNHNRRFYFNCVLNPVTLWRVKRENFFLKNTIVRKMQCESILRKYYKIIMPLV